MLVNSLRKEPELSAEKLYKEGLGFYKKTQWDSAGFYLRQAAIQAKENDSLLIYPNCLQKLAPIYWVQGKHDRVLSMAQDLKKWSIQNKNDTFLLAAYDSFKTYYYMSKKLQDALTYSDSALVLAIAKKDTGSIIKMSLNKAILYVETNNLSDAEIANNYAIKLAENSKYKNHLNNLYTTQASIFFAKKEYQKAYLTYQKEITKTVSKYGTVRGKDFSNMAQICYLMGRYKLAESYLDSAKRYPILIHNTARMDLNQASIDIYASTKQYKKLNEAIEVYKKDIDSLYQYRIEEATKVTRSELAKERQIYDLRESQLEKEYRLKQYQGWGLFASGLLLLIAVAWYLYFRNIHSRREQNRIMLEQRLLRSQMNPHFIFNVLGGLQSLVRKGNNDDALTYMKHFAHLLRQNLELSRNNLVSLHDEIETLSHYLALQQIRFSHRFSYYIYTDPVIDTNQVQLASMLIQPFVENSIEHGFRQIDYPGRIDVRINQNADGSIRIEVEDNGSGLVKTTGLTTKKSSLATQITKERLAWLYHKATQKPRINIDNKLIRQPGVLVTIDLPSTDVSA